MFMLWAGGQPAGVLVSHKPKLHRCAELALGPAWETSILIFLYRVYRRTGKPQFRPDYVSTLKRYLRRRFIGSVPVEKNNIHFDGSQ